MTKLNDIISIYDGNEFEEICCQLLSLMYGATIFQEIPAGDKGDFGLDGYNQSIDAFQCYAPQKYYPTDKLYELQRNKITSDINKFIKNEKELKQVISGDKFNKWVFLTTSFDSKKLNVYAGNKTQEVLNKKLSHVADNFKIVIKEADSFFRAEIPLYLNSNRKYLKVIDPAIDKDDVIDWQSNNTSLTVTLSGKLAKLGLRGSDLNECIDMHVNNYLALDKILTDTYEKNKTVYEDIMNTLSAKTKLIELKSKMGEVQKLKDIQGDLDQLDTLLKDKLEVFIKPEMREQLKTYKISDWLIMCPLDFK